MKFDLETRHDIGTLRTLKNFRETMTQLLQKESLEKISVQEICEISMIPRATFYNYFEDKFDLMKYCWDEFFKDCWEQFPLTYSFNDLENTIVFIFDFIDNNPDFIYRIASKNSDNGQLQNSFKNYIFQIAIEVIEQSPVEFDNLPQRELAAKFSAMTIYTILMQKLKNMKDFTSEDAIRFLEMIVDKDTWGVGL